MTSTKETVLVRLDPTLKQKLREHAAQNRRSMSAVVEQLVQAHMELVSAFEREDTPKETANMNAVTGEHDFSDLDLGEIK